MENEGWKNSDELGWGIVAEPGQTYDGGQTPHGYRRIQAWQRAFELALKCYSLTQDFPKSEMYGLSSHMQRAAVSIPANIAEGWGRHGQTELARFIDIALGSLCELETFVLLAQRLEYGNQKVAREILTEADEIGKMLRAFRRRIKGQS